jgi:hypothetical protein
VLEILRVWGSQPETTVAEVAFQEFSKGIFELVANLKINQMHKRDPDYICSALVSELSFVISDWERHFRPFRFGTFVKELSLGTFVWEHLVRNTCLGPLVWEASFGNFRLGPFVWGPSPGNFRMGAFVCELSLGILASSPRRC